MVSSHVFNAQTDAEVFAELDALLEAGDDEAFDARWATLNSARIDRYQDHRAA